VHLSPPKSKSIRKTGVHYFIFYLQPFHCEVAFDLSVLVMLTSLRVGWVMGHMGRRRDITSDDIDRLGKVKSGYCYIIVRSKA